jgi:hypothetical protein
VGDLRAERDPKPFQFRRAPGDVDRSHDMSIPAARHASVRSPREGGPAIAQ